MESCCISISHAHLHGIDHSYILSIMHAYMFTIYGVDIAYLLLLNIWLINCSYMLTYMCHAFNALDQSTIHAVHDVCSILHSRNTIHVIGLCNTVFILSIAVVFYVYYCSHCMIYVFTVYYMISILPIDVCCMMSCYETK